MSAPVMLVTGGSRGIGAATARLAGECGYHVVVNYMSDAAAAELVVADIVADGGKAYAVRADISDENAILACTRNSIGAVAGSTFWSTMPVLSTRRPGLKT